MELATPLIPTSAIAALPRSRSQSRSPRVMGHTDNDNDDMRSHFPRVSDNANFEFDDPPSFSPPLSPPIGYPMQRDGGDSTSTTGHSSTFPNLSLTAFPLPPTSSSAVVLPPFSSAVLLPPSLSRATLRGREPTSGQKESGERGEDMELSGEREHGSEEGGERMDKELDGVQGMLRGAEIEVRTGLEEWDRM